MFMTDIKVNINRCKGCGLCVPQCPKQLIKMSKEMNEQGSYSPIINKKKCVGCGLCYQMCPDLAIEIKKSEAEGEKNKANVV
jgi:2-oxoglutarate ferredoxin oxidoreductase subunit delta